MRCTVVTTHGCRLCSIACLLPCSDVAVFCCQGISVGLLSMPLTLAIALVPKSNDKVLVHTTYDIASMHVQQTALLCRLLPVLS